MENQANIIKVNKKDYIFCRNLSRNPTKYIRFANLLLKIWAQTWKCSFTLNQDRRIEICTCKEIELNISRPSSVLVCHNFCCSQFLPALTVLSFDKTQSAAVHCTAIDPNFWQQKDEKNLGLLCYQLAEADARHQDNLFITKSQIFPASQFLQNINDNNRKIYIPWFTSKYYLSHNNNNNNNRKILKTSKYPDQPLFEVLPPTSLQILL